MSKRIKLGKYFKNCQVKEKQIRYIQIINGEEMTIIWIYLENSKIQQKILQKRNLISDWVQNE